MLRPWAKPSGWMGIEDLMLEHKENCSIAIVAPDMQQATRAADEAAFSPHEGKWMAEERNHDIRELVILARHLEIAHHVPGRIRLKILPSGFGRVQGVDIEALVLGIPGILGLRINLAARSVIIEYNEALLPFELWQKLGQIRQQPERAEEVTGCLRALLAG